MTVIVDIETFAAIGVGVIGSGWVARALAHGLDVIAWDPAPGAEKQLRENIANAWPALERVGLAAGASPERLRFVQTIEACVGQADFIQESAPEREELKLALLDAGYIDKGKSGKAKLPIRVRFPENVE